MSHETKTYMPREGGRKVIEPEKKPAKPKKEEGAKKDAD